MNEVIKALRNEKQVRLQGLANAKRKSRRLLSKIKEKIPGVQTVFSSFKFHDELSGRELKGVDILLTVEEDE